MDSIPLRCRMHHPLPSMQFLTQGAKDNLIPQKRACNLSWVYAKRNSDTAVYSRKPPKYLRYPRRTKLPSDPGISTFIKPRNEVEDHSDNDVEVDGKSDDPFDGVVAEEKSNFKAEEEKGDDVWEADEVEAISSLFRGRVPQKPGKVNRERPLPLPLPHKIRPLGFPTVKKRVKTSLLPTVSARLSLSNRLYKDPVFLLNLARQIGSLAVEEDASSVLNKWGRFLCKGSLSLTIRELGHMGLPERALQTFCWAQKQTHLFPDDRILGATVEILARAHQLKLPFDLKKFVSLASSGVLEAITRGFIRGGRLNLAWRLLSAARNGKRVLDCSIYAKLIAELGKSPDKDNFVVVLLEELGARDGLNLTSQDCTTIMKVCVRLRKFEFVESLFNWFRKSGNCPSIVMYTTVIHSRLSAMNYREASALVWEMEGLDCLFDLPAYRVVIKLFVALNDLPRASRYFSKMKMAGFAPTYDVYRDMMCIYLLSGRLAKYRDVCKEIELAGYKLDAESRSELLKLERNTWADV